MRVQSVAQLPGAVSVGVRQQFGFKFFAWDRENIFLLASNGRVFAVGGELMFASSREARRTAKELCRWTARATRQAQKNGPSSTT